MGIYELYELKGQYERELIMAEAKVSVINDIIAIAESNKQDLAPETAPCEEFTNTEDAVEPNITVDESY